MALVVKEQIRGGYRAEITRTTEYPRGYSTNSRYLKQNFEFLET